MSIRSRDQHFNKLEVFARILLYMSVSVCRYLVEHVQIVTSFLSDTDH